MKKESYTIITGASGGIGEAFANVCAEHGHNLILVARDKTKLEAVKKSITQNVVVRIVSADLSEASSGEYLEEYITKNNLAIDTLINNAGFGDYAYFERANRDKLLNMIDLNIRSLTELTHRFLPLLGKQKRAHVLNVASIAAFLPGPGMAVYYATKHYVLAFSEGLAEELRNTSVKVTVLCPGPTASGFQTASAMGKSSLVKNKKLPSALSVAEYGYNAMIRGKVIATPSLGNKLTTQASRLLPRSVVRRIINRVQNH